MASSIIKRSAEVRTPQASFELMPEIVNGGTLSSLLSVSAVIVNGTYANTTVSGASAWSSVVSYVPGDVVTNGGSTYICIAANVNQTPPNSAYWVLTITIGSTAIATGNKIVNMQISGGTNGDVYWITCKVTTTGGSTLESIVPVKISDSPIGYTE